VRDGSLFSPQVTGFTLSRARLRDPAIGKGVWPSPRRREPTMIAMTAVSPPAVRTARGLCASLAATWRAVTHDLFDSYRPERHYMRGPGPKWRVKHAMQCRQGAVGT
jgi:hypothetical protein